MDDFDVESGEGPIIPPPRLFDRDRDYSVVERRLPHWSQTGTVSFVTWRAADSMPGAVLGRWQADRTRWLKAHGIDPTAADWRRRLERLGPEVTRGFRNEFWNRWHDELDRGHGAGVLRRPELARIVGDSLRHFDGERYSLFDFVVMPNHVHVLVSFPDEAGLLAQCESWKRFTATQINRLLGNRGRFWQQDDFDHLVRSEEQFWYLRDYLAANPTRAGLRAGKYLHYTKSLSGPHAEREDYDRSPHAPRERTTEDR
jgi:type I restriction enzyme R subunit